MQNDEDRSCEEIQAVDREQEAKPISDLDWWPARSYMKLDGNDTPLRTIPKFADFHREVGQAFASDGNDHPSRGSESRIFRCLVPTNQIIPVFHVYVVPSSERPKTSHASEYKICTFRGANESICWRQHKDLKLFRAAVCAEVPGAVMPVVPTKERGEVHHSASERQRRCHPIETFLTQITSHSELANSPTVGIFFMPDCTDFHSCVPKLIEHSKPPLPITKKDNSSSTWKKLGRRLPGKLMKLANHGTHLDDVKFDDLKKTIKDLEKALQVGVKRLQEMESHRRHYSQELEALIKTWNQDSSNVQWKTRIASKSGQFVHKAAKKLQHWRKGHDNEPLMSALKEQLQILEQIMDQLRSRQALRSRIVREEEKKGDKQWIDTMRHDEQEMSACILREYSRVTAAATRVLSKALRIYAIDSSMYYRALQEKFRLLSQEAVGHPASDESSRLTNDPSIVDSESDEDEPVSAVDLKRLISEQRIVRNQDTFVL